MSKYLYTCGVDWQCEIGEAPDLEGNQPLYSTIEELKATRKCWKSCGIVKIKLDLVEWVEPQNLFSDEGSENE